MQDQRELDVDTPKGSIFVRELPGRDPPFILMHGFPDDHRIYGKLAALADDLMADDNQRLWMLLRWSAQLEIDASDPGNVAGQSILPQFLGSADQPDARAAIRGWTRVLLDSLDRQDALIERGAVRDLELPVSVIFGERDRYLNPALAAEIAPTPLLRRLAACATRRYPLPAA